MPRKARIDAPGALHHIIGRGIERQRIFWDEQDRQRFVERLSRILKETFTGCYAWALLANHFHLLLRTGQAPIAHVMSRLLTGYVLTFNRRHNRNGHLFQNRYLLELVRYIHLNPLRAGAVETLQQLDRYPYRGHHALMGYDANEWQDVEKVLGLLGKSVSSARKRYRGFVEKGIARGKRPDLVGGGLIRSSGGWAAFKTQARERVHLKGDERILGDSDFVETVLDKAREQLEQRYRLQAEGFDFAKVVSCVSNLLDMSQPAVSKAVQRGEKLALENNLILLEETGIL